MGCDIHGFLERKHPHEDKWRLDKNHKADEDGWWNSLDFGRNYELFGKLAGVRSMSNIRPKGIPKDASSSYLKAIQNFGMDGHSHSWCSMERYAKVCKELYEESGIECGLEPYDFDVKTSKSRNPFDIDWSSKHFWETVLCYVHDEKEKANAIYILSQDPDFLTEKFRLVFYFDN